MIKIVLFFLFYSPLYGSMIRYQPNSIEYFRDFFTLKLSEEKSNSYHHQFLDYALSFRITETEHPLDYKNGDIHLSFYPTCFLKYFDEFSTLYGGIPFLLETTMHTSLGAPSISLGYGPMFKKQDTSQLKFLGISYYGAYHTVFLNEDFFIRLGFFSSISEKISHKTPQIQWIYFSLGYFNKKIADYLGFSF